MSQEDRARWEARYQKGAYAQRDYPSAYLLEQVHNLPQPAVGRALDVACGAGRNATYLAELGFEVTAVDIAESALARITHPRVTTVCHDLDLPLDAAHQDFQVVVMLRYLDLALIPDLAQRLVDEGVLLVEVLAQSEHPSVGPSSSRFRAAPGTLSRAVEETGLQVLHSYEGAVTDPDGRTAQVARITARKGTV